MAPPRIARHLCEKRTELGSGVAGRCTDSCNGLPRIMLCLSISEVFEVLVAARARKR